jgi:hypothetical protein
MICIKRQKNNRAYDHCSNLMLVLCIHSNFLGGNSFNGSGSSSYTNSKTYYAYMTGAKNGLAAAIVDQYNVGAACASFTGSDLDHCIPDYYSVVAGYQYDVFSFRSSAFNLSSFSG